MRRPNLTRTGIFFWLIILAGLVLNTPQAPAKPVSESPGDLIITELMAANRTGLTDEDGDYADWVEIYNRGRQAVNLAGWSLTDDPHEPAKWTFPDITLGSYDYLLIFASGKDRKPTQPGRELHTNFKLNHRHEFLGLYNIFQAQFMDVVGPPGQTQPETALTAAFPQQVDDVSYGRPGSEADGSAGTLAYGYLTTPTPGQANVETLRWADLVAPVEFSRAHGFYDAPFSLELSSPTPGATIRYTTDGSEPTATHGTVYTAPLTISSTTPVRAGAFKPNFRPSAVETRTYIFLASVLAQPAEPVGFPQIWGGYQGAPVMADYEMDPNVVDDPRYAPALSEALTSIPTLAIVTDQSSFHDLYANPGRRGRAWERPASIELIEPEGKPGFQINAGLRIQGGLGRSESIPKHSFRLFFRREYGAAKLNYPLFPGSLVEEFETLTLRSGVNRSYAGYQEREDDLRLTTYTRDEWYRSSQIAMSGVGAHGTFVQLYLNGLYWGLYNIVERPDAAFMASYFGGEETDWETITHAESLNTSSERFKTLYQLAQAGHLERPEQYATMESYLDIPQFIDYLILNWYVGNLDWGFNNWYAGVRPSSGPVRYFAWDGERTWYTGAEIFMDQEEYLDRPNMITPLFEALLANPDFKIELADRLYRHLFNDGPLTDTNARTRWLNLCSQIEPAIIAESARWGDSRFDPPLTQADWFAARDDVLAQMEGNVTRLVGLAREAGYYPDFDPPVFNQRGGRVAAGFQLTMSLPASSTQGTIYYTTDGSDPRVPVTGAVASTANRYDAPLTLTTTTLIKARVLKGDTWSALNEARFQMDETAGHVQITEIMYNPPGGDDYEFIELKNTGEGEVNLAGMSFEGIRFTFPAHAASLPPGEFMVLVRNPAAFARRYPGVAIAGVYEGQLSNKGEKIALTDAQGQTILSLEYDDEAGWPLSPDGWGDSLVRVGLNQAPGDPRAWQASSNRYGSPGADDSILGYISGPARDISNRFTQN